MPTLGKNAKNGDYTRVWNDVWSYTTLANVKQQVKLALHEMKQVLANYTRIGYAWSGGKDSIGIQLLLEEFGYYPCVLGVMSKLEFPQYLDWCYNHLPQNCDVIDNPVPDLEFLSRKPHLVFPLNSRDGYWWTMNGTRKGQRAFVEKHNIDLLVLGRRRIDGNNVPSGKQGLFTTKHYPYMQYNPIRNWSHETLFGYLRYRQAELPPTYSYPLAWETGTGPWAGRRIAKSHEQGFRMTYECDSSVVKEASEFFPSAKTVCETYGL